VRRTSTGWCTVVVDDTIRIEVTNRDVRRILKAFRDLPKDASDELRDANQRIADALAAKVAAAATASDAQSALMAQTVQSRRDRVPVVVAGGRQKVGSRRTPAYKILYGSEFGATYWRQFRPHRGAASYWLFRTVRENEDDTVTDWAHVAEAIARKWGHAT